MAEAWLVLAGPTRTGTTSLFRHLASAPGIRASRVKETDYFLSCLRSGEPARLADYRALFAPGEGLRVEASPLYCPFAREIGAMLRALPGDVKVVLTFREPVARFSSLYAHVVTKRRVGAAAPPEAFVQAALAAADAPRDPHALDSLAFVEGCYRELLDEWLQAVGPERLRVVFFESLAAGEDAVLAALNAWLGLAPAQQPAAPLPRENSSRAVRAEGLHKLALALNTRLEPQLNRLPWLRGLLRSVYYRFNEKPADDPLPPALRAQLAQAYAARNAGLRAQVAPCVLGPVPGWVR